MVFLCMCILSCELSCVLSCVLQQQMMSYCFLSLFGQSMAAFNALRVMRGCLCVVSRLYIDVCPVYGCVCVYECTYSVCV